MTRFLLLSDICSLHVEGRLPWQEDGSVIYSYNLLSHLMSHFRPYVTVSYETPPNLEGQVPSLMKSRICSFQFLPGIAGAAFLRPESQRTHECTLLSLFLRLPQPGGPGSCIYFPQEQGSPVIYPRALGLPKPTHRRTLYTSPISLCACICIQSNVAWQ
jgi:hypothetical protein